MPPARTSAATGTSRSRTWAAWALVIWVLGFEVGPDVHLALHDVLAPHVHGHGDARAHAHVHAHDHDHPHAHAHGATHEHVASAWSPARVRAAIQALRRDPTRDMVRASDRPAGAIARVFDPEHGRHAAAHRGIAVLAPSPLLPPIIADAWRPIEKTWPPSGSRDERAPEVLRARGPPCAIEPATA